MYMFQGISLVTQNYINPAIDTIKKKGIVSCEILITLTELYSLARLRHHECHLAGFLELCGRKFHRACKHLHACT